MRVLFAWYDGPEEQFLISNHYTFNYLCLYHSLYFLILLKIKLQQWFLSFLFLICSTKCQHTKSGIKCIICRHNILL